jgi:hypothetical protein
MASITDILSDGSGDIQIGTGGDFAIGDCRADMVERLLRAGAGEFKFYAELGVGIVRALGSNGDLNSIKVKLIEDMKRCGIDYKTIEVINEQIEVRF